MRNLKTFLLIALLVAIFGYIDLPRALPINITTPFFSFNHTLSRPALDFRVGNTRIVKDFEPSLGLDLQGGGHIVFEADTTNIPEADRDSALESAKNVIERRVNLFGTTEPVIQTSRVGESRRIIVELPGVTDVNQAINIIGATAKLTFLEESTEAAQIATNSAFGPFTIKTNLTGGDLRRAQVTFDQRNGAAQVALDFNDEGRKKFADITARNVGKRLAIVLDDQIISAPTVSQSIPDGNAVINGNFSTDEAKSLALQLNAGALPVPINVIEQRTVGATLGAESVQKSIIAGVIGLSIVMLFMAFFYGIAGILANIALLIYTLITFGLFKTIPITLTLAGIAGFILSIGMAVDANILIFERMKEEMRWGKKRIPALEAGFSRAWSSIRDSNIASLMTCAILLYFGSGIVRGFAITLALGILVSMFSAIFVTRTFLRMVYRERNDK